MITAQLPFNILIGEERAEKLTPLHWHDAFEIGYVLEGTGLFLIEGRSFPFRPGQVHVINDTDRHMAYADDRARFFNVHFHPDLLRDDSFPALANAALMPFTLGSRRLSPLLPAGNPHTGQIIRLLQSIADEHRAAAPYWPLAVKGLVLQIVTLLLRHFVDPTLPDAATLRRQELLARLAPALRLIEQHLSVLTWGNRPINVPVTTKILDYEPFKKLVADNPGFQEMIDMFLKGDRVGLPPKMPVGTFYADRLGAARDKIRLLEATPAEALKQVTEEVQKELDNFYQKQGK